MQEPGPAHSATVRFCLSCLAPQGAFRLVRSSQVASRMHHPDTPLPPSPIIRALSHPVHLDHPPIPPSTGPVPRPPALVQQTPAPFPPHSASLLPLLLPPPATSNLCPTTPNPTYLTWPLSPSHIHQTHHTYPQPLSLNRLRLRIKRLSKVTDSIIIKKTEITNIRTRPGSDCTVSKKERSADFYTLSLKPDLNPANHRRATPTDRLRKHI